MMSGLVLPVEIPTGSTYHTIRSLVFQALPDDIRPEHGLQLNLLYDDEDEQEEEQEQEQEEEQEEKEQFVSLLIEDNTYEISMRMVEEGTMSCACNGKRYPYERYQVWMKNGNRREWSKTFLVKSGSRTLDRLYPEWETSTIYGPSGDPDDEYVDLFDCERISTPSDFFQPLYDEEMDDSLHAFFVRELVELWGEMKSVKSTKKVLYSWADETF
jgi:hypothetical protein